MTNYSIPIIEAHGTHREVGKRIGKQGKAQIQSMLVYLRENIPAGFTWEQIQNRSNDFLVPSRVVYPQYIEELAGIAEGAEIAFEDIFVSMCEELWEVPIIQGCTDMAAGGPGKLGGTTLS